MKKNVTYIAQAAFETIAKELGLPWVEQKGFVKVQAAAGRAVYVANTKRVGRVDLSGFLFSGPGVRDLGGERFCSVDQQVDFSRPEADVLATFRAVLEHMTSLAPRAKEPRKQLEPKAPKAPAAATAPTEGEAPTPPTEEDVAAAKQARKEANLARLARIRQVAAEKGLAVSPETEARLSADAE